MPKNAYTTLHRAGKYIYKLHDYDFKYRRMNLYYIDTSKDFHKSTII